MAEKDKQVFDVEKPGKSAPDATSKPIILGHKPLVQDPMVNNASAEEKKEDPTPPPSVTRKVIAPDPVTEEAKPAAEATAAAPSEKEESPPESSDAAVVDAVAEQAGSSKNKQQLIDEEELKKQEALQKLIEEKKYFVPIGQARRRRNKRSALLVLAVLVIVVGAAAAADAGFIKPGFKLPFDFIKNSSAANTESVDSVAQDMPFTTETEEKKPETKPFESLTEYKSTDLAISFKYPSTWKVSNCEGSKAVSFLIVKESAKCFTEDRTDGPTFYKDTQGYKSCDNIGTDSFTKRDCQKIKLGEYEVILTTSTYIKEGAFGEPVGAVHHQYDFLASNLRVAYSFWPNEKNQKEVVETIIQSIKVN